MSNVGTVELKDGTILKLKITIVDARESGFSPFGGVNIAVKAIGGIGVVSVPNELKKRVSKKPIAPAGPPPEDGWEIVDIINYTPAAETIEVETFKGPFQVMVKGEPTMASRNLNYRTELGEPLYWLNWVNKISWKPKSDEKC